MRFVWNPASLETTCGSQTQLERRWPMGWRSIQLLLTYSSNALTVAELSTVRALDITAYLPRIGSPEGGLTIRHQEIEMSTTLLTPDGLPIAVQSINEVLRTAGAVRCLRVEGFTERKLSVKRLAS